MSSAMLSEYFGTLINLFFKILPLRESGEASLGTYMRSLQAELLGCGELVDGLKADARMLTLASVLQYLIDNPEAEVSVVRREVFRAISICGRLKEKYAAEPKRRGGDTRDKSVGRL